MTSEAACWVAAAPHTDMATTSAYLVLDYWRKDRGIYE